MSDKELILVVDDDPDLVDMVATKLAANNYRIAKAYDGVQAWEQIRKEKPAMVIMDVMMPKESGIHMYREVKKDPQLSGIPVIMVSALSKKTFFHSQKVVDEYEGVQMPEPAAYIEKPPEADELLEVIRKILP